MKNKYLIVLGLICSVQLYAESQGGDYKGITDPFGDPSSYEFADDEKEDKEFFHLGRFLMLGADIGIGLFTAGLGRTIDPTVYAGGRVQYFLDRTFAIELAGHYANHLNKINPSENIDVEIETVIIPFTAGLRYYFDIRNAPKAIALANPYLAAGAGGYIRQETVLKDVGITASIAEASTTSFGAYGGGGIEFLLYRHHVYMGIDLRYHFVFFPDEDQPIEGIPSAERDGDYFSSVLTITYNF